VGVKILCVVPSYYPAFKFGGPIASVHNLNKALVKQGAEITVYTTNVGLEDKVFANSEANLDGVKVFYFGFSKIFEFVGPTGWQFSLPMTKALRENVKNFDIVYLSAIWNYPTAIAAYYCRKHKKPYVVAPRGIFYPYTFNKKVWKKWPYYKLIIEKILKKADAIHYTTQDEFSESHLFLKLRNNGFIVPNGINLLEFKDLPPHENLASRYPALKGKKIILFLSRLDWKKGLDILAGAYGILAKKRDDVFLLVVGDGQENFKKKVKKWFEEAGVTDKVFFAGMLTGKEKLEAFSGSDVFVLPSYSENFGMVVVEAMACGLPVVVSNGVGMHHEIQETNSGIVTSLDKGELAEALDKMLNNKEMANQMVSNAGKLLVEKYEINKTAEEILKIFQKILYT